MKNTAAIFADALPLARPRLADYVELTRPRIASLVLFTEAAGFWLASAGAPDLLRLMHTLIATALVAAGASALNQVLERQSDALMERTRNRPLPSGRLRPEEAILFGAVLALGGLAYLALTVRQPLAVLAAGFAFAAYVLLYTPLKRKTTLNTLVGAVPGALPPVIGWTAVSGSFGAEAGALFAVVFLWQVPHFLAIAWIYREDYGRAGLCMLPSVDPEGGATGRQMIVYCLALLAASLMPVAVGGAGPVYLAGALIVGIGFLACAIGFSLRHSTARARGVLRASLIYLQGLLTLWMLDGIPHR
jgi:protoheme IX farnesyltransferase